MPAVPSPFAPVADGVRVAVRLTPKARRNGVDGLAADAEGAVALRVAVTAVPEGGKANAALIGLLAKEWRVPRTSISVSQGAADRRKTLHVAGDPAALLGALESWWRNREGKRT